MKDLSEKKKEFKLKEIPLEGQQLFKKRAFGHLATIMPDGSPQVSSVWVASDGKYLIINSACGRQKDLNMRRDGRVAVEVTDPDDPYRYLLVRGRVIEITETGADQQIDCMSLRYRGTKYPRIPGQIRVIYKIRPEHVTMPKR